MRRLTVYSAKAAVITWTDHATLVMKTVGRIYPFSRLSKSRNLRPSINEGIKASRELAFFFGLFDHITVCHCL